MKIVCDACGAKYSIADEKVAGKVFKIRCKKCSNIIVVRGNAEEAAAAAPQEQQPNKDTKVFDYQGYDSPQDAMGDEGEWHLVIDQEQVGPMTSAEVRQRFAQGDVDSESYIWKEGFADWERLPDVPEFADLEGGQATVAAPVAAAVAPADGGMFGGSDPMPEATTESPSALAAAAASSDLFGADSGAGADLFGGGDAGAGASQSADLFGGGAPIGENTGEVVMSKEAEAQLKGQRNENSVLFSLGNLAALASDSPKPMAAAPAASSGGGISNTGGSEGSGLIDIRSMASVYLADKGGAAGGGAATPIGSADDLPVFSQSAFESASPVLLPTQSSGTDKKVLYALVGVIAALVVAAAILIIVVLKGDDDKGSEVAAGAATTDTGIEAAKPMAEGEGTEPTPTDPVEAATTDPTPTETDPETTGETPTEPETTEPDKVPEEPKTMTRAERRKAQRDAKREASSSSKPKTPTTKPEPKPTSGGGSCDEVTCLVDPGAACCRKFKSKSSSSASSSSSNSNLPSSPTKSDISKGISKVKGRVMSCGDKHGGKGTVKVKIKIGGNGKVQSANASGGGSALRSCIASAVKRASFSKSQKGVTVNYPFVFR